MNIKDLDKIIDNQEAFEEMLKQGVKQAFEWHKDLLSQSNQEIVKENVTISQLDASCFGGLMIRHLGHPNFQDEISGIKELCEMFLELNSKLKYKFKDDEVDFVTQLRQSNNLLGDKK